MCFRKNDFLKVFSLLPFSFKLGFRPRFIQIEGFGLLSLFWRLRGPCFQDTKVGRGQRPSGKSREKSWEKSHEKSREKRKTQTRLRRRFEINNVI